MKSLEKATEDYERAKARAEHLQKKAAQAVRRMKECEAAKIEAENNEIVHIVRETELTIEELREWKNRGRTGLPGAAEPGKETTDGNENTDNGQQNPELPEPDEPAPEDGREEN